MIKVLKAIESCQAPTQTAAAKLKGWWVVETRDDAWGPFKTEDAAKTAAYNRASRRAKIKYGEATLIGDAFKELPVPTK